MHIAVAGNIGCGKTTLTNMLAKHYGWEPRFESVEYNPYLSDFYADMARWSFNLQIYFLKKRFKDVVEIDKQDKWIIQDRTIYEDARIFAPNLHEQGKMSDRDFDNYRDLFDLMMSLVKMPDLLIYVRASIPTLISQIQKRGRGYEQTMRIDYLQGLNDKYEAWIKDYKTYGGDELYLFKPGASHLGVQIYAGEMVNTSDFVFSVTELTDTSVVMSLPFAGGGRIEQRYSIREGEYIVANTLSFIGMENVIPKNVFSVDLDYTMTIPRM